MGFAKMHGLRHVERSASKMTYIVSSGALNSTHLLTDTSNVSSHVDESRLDSTLSSRVETSQVEFGLYLQVLARSGTADVKDEVH